jgi:hypothetical protein
VQVIFTHPYARTHVRKNRGLSQPVRILFDCSCFVIAAVLFLFLLLSALLHCSLTYVVK